MAVDRFYHRDRALGNQKKFGRAPQTFYCCFHCVMDTTSSFGNFSQGFRKHWLISASSADKLGSKSLLNGSQNCVKVMNPEESCQTFFGRAPCLLRVVPGHLSLFIFWLLLCHFLHRSHCCKVYYCSRQRREANSFCEIFPFLSSSCREGVR